MGREKIVRGQEREIIYDEDRFKLLESMRDRAKKLFEMFKKERINCLTYGSIARGNVRETSDIDILITRKIPTYRIGLILEQNSIIPITRKIVQATPNNVIKINYELAGEVSISVPMTDFTRQGLEFYKFGGCLNYKELMADKRVPGVDKRLVLIIPTEKGHKERSLLMMRYDASKIIGVSQEMINQRIRVLNKRDKVGRTGVFLERDMHPSENAEEVLRNLARENHLIRKRL